MSVDVADWEQTGPFPIPMQYSEGTGVPLLQSGRFGADIIHFEPGKGVAMHTHPGQHILFVTDGCGTLELSDRTLPLSVGMCYLIRANKPHAVRASHDMHLTMIAVADDHRPVDSPERLDPVRC